MAQLSSWPAPSPESQHPVDQQRGSCPCSVSCSDRCWHLAAFPASRQLSDRKAWLQVRKPSSWEAWKDTGDTKVLNPFCPWTAKGSIAGNFSETRILTIKNNKHRQIFTRKYRGYPLALYHLPVHDTLNYLRCSNNAAWFSCSFRTGFKQYIYWFSSKSSLISPSSNIRYHSSTFFWNCKGCSGSIL